MAKLDFVFVDQSGSNTKEALQQNRKTIRSQARRHALVQWKTDRMENIEIQLVHTTANGDKECRRLVPEGKRRATTKRSRGTKKAVALRKSSPLDEHDKAQSSSRLSPSLSDMPLVGYAKARSNYNFELTWLSAFVTNHIGCATVDPKAPVPHRTTVLDWIDQPGESYLQHIPILYDISPLIKDLVDALLVKARFVLCSKTKQQGVSESEVLSRYGKALRSVQNALKDDQAIHAPETLCATQLIQLYQQLEVDSAPAQIWITHTRGLHHLIQMRGPKRFANRLERALLSTQMQHIFNQAFTQDQDCFYEQDEWQDLLQDMVEDATPSFTTVYISLWKTIACLPRLLRQGSRYILDSSCSLDPFQLIVELRLLKSRISAWRFFNQEFLRDPLMSSVYSNTLNSGFFSVSIILNRLLLALRPIAPDAVELEEETQEHATDVMALKTGKIATGGFYIGLIAKATEKDWSRVAENDDEFVDELRDVVAQAVWMKLMAMMGRVNGLYGNNWS